ncbi:MAG: FtsX-like permease family protein [Endomicrobium sp.]|jgi:putative ABC transport system permease protein|nr:FtsX-like permease family protein [Endomicrobium sp.]
MKMKRYAFYLKMVTSSLIRRRSRMFVALLAVAVGATILSGLITIYYDIPRQMGKEFRSYGANLIFIPSEDKSYMDADSLKKAVSYLSPDDIVGVTPYRYKTVKINEQPFMAAGADLAQAAKTSPFWYVSGRWPQKEGEALIGQEVADIIRLNAGSQFFITGMTANNKPFKRGFTVSGIVQTGGSEEAFIFMSLADFENMAGGDNAIDIAECSVSVSAAELDRVSKIINENVEGVTARPVKRISESEGTVLKKLQSLVYLVTVVILLLTMICVATTMMAAVAERRREIGLKKALGATNAAIVAEFIGEDVFLGIFGGLLGAAFGFVFAQAVSINVFARSITFQPLLAPITVFASIIITAAACFIPVRRAAEIDPAIVLRGE